jgi:hypothetical protein
MIGPRVLVVAAAALLPAAAAAPAPAFADAAVAVHARVAITLTVADNGRTIRVRRGQQIDVLLKVDPRQFPDRSTWWSGIVEYGAALSVRPQTQMLVRGAAGADFRAVGHGEAALSSTRRPCPAVPGKPTCHSMQAWQVMVEVR